MAATGHSTCASARTSTSVLEMRRRGKLIALHIRHMQRDGVAVNRCAVMQHQLAQIEHMVAQLLAWLRQMAPALEAEWALFVSPIPGAPTTTNCCTRCG